MQAREYIFLKTYFHHHEKLRAESQLIEEKFKATRDALSKSLEDPNLADQKLIMAIDAGNSQIKLLQEQYSKANKEFQASLVKYEKAILLQKKLEEEIAKQAAEKKATLRENFLFWKKTSLFEKVRDDSLFLAIKKGEVTPVTRLLHQYPILNQTTTTLEELKESSVTPLMAAIFYQHSVHNLLVEFFLQPEIGVDVNVQTRPSGFTALHFAVRQGNLQDVIALLARNANPLIKDAKGNIPRQLLQDAKDETSALISEKLIEDEKLAEIKKILFQPC